MDLTVNEIRSTEGSIRKLCGIRDRSLARGEDVTIINKAILNEGKNLKRSRLVRRIRGNNQKKKEDA